MSEFSFLGELSPLVQPHKHNEMAVDSLDVFLNIGEVAHSNISAFQPFNKVSLLLISKCSPSESKASLLWYMA